MKKVLLFVVILATISSAFAQQGNGRNRQGQKSAPKIGVLSGKVIDADSKMAVEYATIAVINKKDNKIVAGGTTDRKGKFIINEIPIGKYQVRISFIGYENFFVKEPITISPRNPEVYLGTIALESQAIGLEEVNIVDQREMMETTLDKKRFNVSKDNTTAGGDATEILNNIPSVDVDIDGNISLRGNESVTILIDGKPSTLTAGDPTTFLQQLPANSIENIEIITNPSAKYDPEGMAGIININLKKERLTGTNGSINLTAGTRDKYNASLNLNHFTGKFNVFGSYSFRDHNRKMAGYLDQTQYYQDVFQYRNFTYDTNTMDMGSHMIKAGIDYYIDNTSNITLSGVYSLGDFNRIKPTEIYYYDENDILTGDSSIYNDFVSDRISTEVTLDYRKRFLRPGQELTATLRYSQNDSDGDSWYGTYRNDLTTGASQKYVAQADYIHPFDNGMKLEAGYRSDISRTNDELEYFNVDTDGTRTINTIYSNDFYYDLDIHALYGIFSGKLSKFTYQAGLRAEQVYTTSTLKNTDSTYINNYFSLYPSVHLSYKVGENSEIMASYSRRVKRPRSRSLNPFRIEAMPGNVRYGNPYLKPEYIDSYEVAYMKQWKRTTLTAAVYYKQIHDLMSRVTLTYDSINEHTMANLDRGVNYGLEFTANTQLTKWWRINASLNTYQQEIQGSNLDGSELSANGGTWKAKLMTTITPFKGNNIQVSWRYNAPRVIAGGQIEGMHRYDIAIKQSILKNKGFVSLRFSDPFKLSKFEMNKETITDDYLLDMYRLREFESQVIYLTFNYSFGKLDERKKKNRKKSSRSQGGDDDMMEDGL
jgi:outer membrane receptor protein involved in Fe transport